MIFRQPILMPLKIQSVDAFINWHRESAINIFRKQKELLPTMGILGPDQSVYMMMFDFKDKDYDILIAKKFCRQIGAIACSLASEAWVSTANRDDKAEVERIIKEGASKQLNKVEILMVTSELKAGKPAMTAYPIIRSGDFVTVGSPLLKDHQELSGRMTNVLNNIFN